MTRSVRVAAALYLGVACAPNLDPDYGTGAEPSGECRPGLAPHDVQGATAQSPLVGQTVAVSGVVTLAASTPAERPGFFLESLEPDADPLTSEGLFVAWSGPPPAAGRRVRALGTVGEAQGLTELAGVERLDECGTGAIAPRPLDVRSLDDPEPWEGMWVRALGDWSLIDVPGRDGVVTASPRGRIFASGHALASDAAAELWSVRAEAAAEPSAVRSEPWRWRRGAELDAIEGVLVAEGSSRQLLAREQPPWPSRAPAAPARPEGSTLRVVGLNLHNYFVSLDARGARSAGELARQRDALVAALVALDADILALTELENRGTESLVHLLEGLDRELPGELRYVFEEASDGAPPQSAGPLRAGIAFRPQRVRARGAARFSNAAGFRRAPLFQSFESEGLSFSLGVVHLASKRCDTEPTLVPDEGCGEQTRRREAELLLAEAQALAASAASEPLLLVGDFNADVREAPLERLARGGFEDLLSALPAPDRYSYVFEGRASLLDHALAPRHFAERVSRVAIWHINADEPDTAHLALEASPPSPRRSSDHDPIVLDLRLAAIRPFGP